MRLRAGSRDPAFLFSDLTRLRAPFDNEAEKPGLSARHDLKNLGRKSRGTSKRSTHFFKGLTSRFSERAVEIIPIAQALDRAFGGGIL
jgi:hypothetical protein